jgi:hypothetical protein
MRESQRDGLGHCATPIVADDDRGPLPDMLDDGRDVLGDDRYRIAVDLGGGAARRETSQSRSYDEMVPREFLDLGTEGALMVGKAVQKHQQRSVAVALVEDLDFTVANGGTGRDWHVHGR